MILYSGFLYILLRFTQWTAYFYAVRCVLFYLVCFSDFCGSAATVDDNPFIVSERLAYNAVNSALQAVAVVKVYGDNR